MYYISMFKRKIVTIFFILLIVVLFVVVYLYYKNINTQLPKDSTVAENLRKEEIKKELLEYKIDQNNIVDPRKIKKDLESFPVDEQSKTPSREEIVKSLNDPSIKIIPDEL